MAGTFDILRANDLIFNYVVSNWLMGQDPPSFDILAWNADSTRMPAAMHAFYLRNFYVREQAGRGHAGDRGPHHRPERDQVADLRRQRDQRPHRAVGVGVQDRRPGQRAGAVRARAAAGTSPGIVNPPGPKAWFLAHDEEHAAPGSAEAWRETAQRKPGTWWEDWARWSGETAGDMIDPPRHGQRPVPGARRRAGALRAHLTGDRPLRGLGAGRADRFSRPLPRSGVGRGRHGADPAARLGGQLARQAARGHGQRRRARAAGRGRGRATASSIAATTSPPGPNTGIATPETPASNSQRVTATRVRRVTVSARRNRSGEVMVYAV